MFLFGNFYCVAIDARSEFFFFNNSVEETEKGHNSSAFGCVCTIRNIA